MEEKIRFRNHISIIVERAGAGFWVLMGILFWQFIDDPEMIQEISQTEDGLFWLLVGLGLFLAVIFLVLFIQYIIWAKTYISVDGTSIIFEKNTLKYQKKTIGIKNISNINTEQNLFEMLVGTCKVKMDTNSMSTADATDLIIVLKKKEAEQFQAYILGIMNKNMDFSAEDRQVKLEQGPGYSDKGASMNEIVVHGLLSIRLISVVVALAAILGLVGVLKDAVSHGTGGLMGALSSILILFFFAGSSLWNIAKGFLQYYDFHVERRESRLYIEYGLIKKVKYTIPVDKINAIRLIQSPQARVLNYYTVELINVGMGDNQEEEKSFFLMYDKAGLIGQKIDQLLPEFAGCQEKAIVRQPISVWAVWFVPLLLTALFMLFGIIVTVEYLPELWMMASPLFAGVLFLIFVFYFLKFVTEGCILEEDVLGICKGTFGRKLIFIKYDKIQYLKVSQNFLAKHFQIIHTTVSLLASSSNRFHEIPYHKEEQVEELKRKILQY